MKASDYIAHFLKHKGITHVFELSGGMITHILDSIHALKSTTIVTMHHEQGVAFAVDGYARIKKLPGVGLATSGPGATNLLTGIGSCYFDSVPAIFITGQVNQHELKGDRPIRQLGFQETDIVSMAIPITKKCFQIQDADTLPDILEEAFNISMSGRPGPVLIDIPMNIQRISIKEFDPENNFKTSGNFSKENPDIIDYKVLDEIKQAILSSEKPLILAGRGILSSNSKELLNEFIEVTNIPVVTSLNAVDAIPFNHKSRVGFIGSYGNRWANIALGNCDCLIVLGSRLDIRQTGAETDSFKAGKKIFHVDIEKGEMNNRVKDCIAINADVKTFLTEAIKFYKDSEFEFKQNWIDEINQLRIKWPDTNEIHGIKGINPNQFIHLLSKASHLAKGYTVDVGSHQMWAAQSVELIENQFFITSGGMGAMGYAFPATIGACFGENSEPVVMISGDGGFQLNIQELQTVKRNNLPLKLVILNNQSLGMIRQFQDSYFDGRHQSTVWGYSAPDFEKVADAYGIEAMTISDTDEIENALSALWKDPKAPFLLQVMIDPKANAYPKIAFGKPITEMEPFAKSLDMEGT